MKRDLLNLVGYVAGSALIVAGSWWLHPAVMFVAVGLILIVLVRINRGGK